ncbi:hypothetical protein [Leptolyngbya ohadii]|uniref:hypothetical protein n=1 Tax=Leptolyngbya ohadii TaxID=1962290 RepID=UPI000B59EB9D|nr:hypothetical protein [Leptolyngbya ohadii]
MLRSAASLSVPRSLRATASGRSSRRTNRFTPLIAAVLVATSLTACQSRQTTVSSTTRTTEPTVQPSPSPLASPSPITSSDIPKPIAETPSKPITPPEVPSKPIVETPSKPDEGTAVQPDEVAVNPDSSLPVPEGVRLGEIQYGSAGAADPALEEAIVNILADRSGDKSLLASTRYTYSRVDLNDDGTSEALVYLTGSFTCGSGGCTMLILEPARESYELVSRMTLVNPPVVVAEEKTAGWKDLMIYVEGGGVTPHYAHLQYDGNRYPSNPSIAPAIASDTSLSGTAVLTEKMTTDSGIQLKL